MNLSLENAGLASLYLALFLDLASGFVLLPVLPFIAIGFHATAFEVGLLSALYFITQFMGKLILGALSDKYGRRKCLLICIGFRTITLVMTGVCTNIFQLCLLRAIDGFFAGTMSIAQAAVLDLVPPDEHAAAMGKATATAGVAAIVGPATGSLLVTWGFQFLCSTMAALSFFNFVLAYSLPGDPDAPPVGGTGGWWGKVDNADDSSEIHAQTGMFKMLVHQPRMLGILSFFFFFEIAFGGFMAMQAVWCRDQLGWTEKDNAVGIAFNAFSLVIFSALLLKPIIRLLHEPGTIWAGISLRIIAFALLATLRAAPWFPYVLGNMVIFSDAFVTPLVPSFIAQMVPYEVRGATVGVQGSITSVGMFFGALILGGIYDYSGPCRWFLSMAALNIAALTIAIPCLWQFAREEAASSKEKSNSGMLGMGDERRTWSPSSTDTKQPLLEPKSHIAVS